MARDEKQIQKRNKITYMILSVVIAIAAWALVAFANNPDITKSFHYLDVVLKGSGELKEKGLIVVDQPKAPELSVKVKGKRSDLIDAIDKTVVEVDLSEISETGTYNLKGNVVLPNSRISVEKMNFSAIPVTVDVYKTVEIPVSVVQTGNIADKIVESIPETETVKVSGAKSELEGVSQAVVQIDLVTLHGSGKTDYEIQLAGKDGEYLTNLHTIEKPAVTVDNVIYDYRELPVKPVLHETLKPLYKLDYNNTLVSPGSIGVGVMPDTDTEELVVIIDEHTEEEREYKIESAEGLYIPKGSENVKIKLEFADAAYSDEVPDDTAE